MRLYSECNALLVGCSDYRNGWPMLPNPKKDIHEVGGVLKELGFHVKTVENPDGDQLRHIFNTLVTGTGRDPNSGVFVFFAGHGHTLRRFDGSKLGYIVPVDAPDPERDPTGFMNRSVSMREIEEICTLIKAKHVLMIFDSCFSGTIFRSAFKKPSQYIKDQILEPVRAFIAAGNENEQVPDQSVFKTCLIQALQHGYADFNKDGFVTGDELGLYLKEEVANYSEGSQHPHYGKIKNPSLDKGDFVFRLASSSSATVEMPAPASQETVLKVTSNIAGAEVSIDGRKTGVVPLTVKRLSPGRHILRVTAAGYEPYEKQISVSSGRALNIEVILEASAQTTIDVSGSPKGAEVVLDGNFAGLVPVRLTGISSGQHSIDVVKKGYQKWSQTIDVRNGETKKIAVDLNPVAPVASEAATLTNRVGMRFVRIPEGSFMMGSSMSASDTADHYGGKAEWYEREHPQHSQRIIRPFYIQTTEVTQKQWAQVMGSNPAKFQNCGENCPVEQVLWDDIQEFISRLNKLEGKTQYRLPTEAEWEYACRGGNPFEFCFGNDAQRLGEYAWYSDNSRYGTSAAGEKKPNAWGLYDMHGNVWEWCDTWYEGYSHETDARSDADREALSVSTLPPHLQSSQVSISDPPPSRDDVSDGPPSATYRVIRGGSWNNSAGNCRSAYRDMRDPGSWNDALGFRLVKDP